LSISEPHPHASDFDAWIAEAFAERGAFTLLIVLVEISETKVMPLSSTFLHVIGDEIEWATMGELLGSSGRAWDGACFFPVATADGLPLDNSAARTRLGELKLRLDEDRLVLNEGYFCDRWGRQIRVDEIPLQ
jgi:hypothetical protein